MRWTWEFELMSKPVWKPANKVDLIALEDRLPPSKKVVATWLPDKGACYMIVDAKPKR